MEQRANTPSLHPHPTLRSDAHSMSQRHGCAYATGARRGVHERPWELALRPWRHEAALRRVRLRLYHAPRTAPGSDQRKARKHGDVHPTRFGKDDSEPCRRAACFSLSERQLRRYRKTQYSPDRVRRLYGSHAAGAGGMDALFRIALWTGSHGRQSFQNRGKELHRANRNGSKNHHTPHAAHRPKARQRVVRSWRQELFR